MITMSNQFYTVVELCELLKVKRLTIYRWIKSGKLKAIKIGKEFRFTKQEIDNLTSSKATK